MCAMHMVCLKDVHAAGVPLTITFTLAFLNLGLRCLHVQHRLKWNEAYPHQLVAPSMSILDSFSAISLNGIQYSMINSSCYFKKCNWNLDPDFCKFLLPQNFLHIIVYLSTWCSLKIVRYHPAKRTSCTIYLLAI